jgi:uncharacterized repeat protein (TIGR01451 family)
LIGVLFGTLESKAERPQGCSGSALGINLYTDIGNVHVGDTINYSATVFNGLVGSPLIACDATAIIAGIVTPDGRTNMLTLRRTALVHGESDFYENVVSYVVRSQDIQADGTLKATAFDNGDIHQNVVLSRGGAFQGVNTKVNLPGITITAQCTGSTGENGAIQFTGVVTNSGNNDLIGVTVTNLVNGARFQVLAPTNIGPGKSVPFTGSWIPANPCLPSTAKLVAEGSDDLTATPVSVTSSVDVTCANVLTPKIVVTKACPVAPVGPGQLLVYSGTVSNAGDVTLTDVVVVSDQPGANTPVFTVARLAPGEVANFTGSYTAPVNCSSTSTLTARAASVCGVAVTSSASSTCPILTTPQIAVTVVCPTGIVAPGSVLTYGGTVQNTGDIPLNNVVVVSDRPGPNTTLFTVARLAPGATANFTGNYTVPANSVCGVVTTVTASGKDSCTGTAVANTAVANCSVTTAPSIAVTLACPTAPVAIGAQVTYTGTVRNSGNVILNNVNVVSGQGDSVFTAPSLAPGASSNFVVVMTAPADACSVSRTVTATGSDACSTVIVSNTASATCPLVTAPRITVTQNCPANPVSLGGVLTYTGTVANAGNVTLTNVVVLSDRTGTTPVFTVATLAPGASANFTGSFTVPAGSACSVTSTLTGSGNDRCAGTRVTASVTTTCPVLTMPAIQVTQACPSTPTAQGGTLTFTGTVKNTGNITLTDVVVLNDRVGTTPVFKAATLAPGAVANFSGRYTVPTNCCTVSSTLTATAKDSCSQVSVQDTATSVCPVLTSPKIVVTKVCPTKTLEPGDLLKYTGTVSNAGNITLVDVTVTNSQSTGGARILGPITLAPGETVNYAAAYIVPVDFCGTDTVTASGYGSCTQALVTSSVTTTCPVTTSPRILVTQSCPTLPTLRGGTHTFTGTVSNPGNVTLTNVFVINNQPEPNTPVLGPITLAPGVLVSFSGSYTAPAACCEILSTLTASGQDRCGGTTVSATSSKLCPLMSTPIISVTRVCPTTAVPVGGQFTFSGTVSNTGDVYLTNVFVYSSQPVSVLTWQPGAGRGIALKSLSGQNSESRLQAVQAAWYDCQGPNLSSASTSLAGNNTPVLGPIQLAPGESKKFSGTYTVTAGSDPKNDVVTASGMDTCRARTVYAAANCAGPTAVTSTTPDIILQSDDGFLGAWFMNGTDMVSSAFLDPNQVNDPRWTVAGSGDFSGNGDMDLLFQHADGTLALWGMDGVRQSSPARLLVPGKPADPNVKAVATGDFNRDGKTDVLFQNTDGALSVWYMDGSNQISIGAIPLNPGSNWKAVGTGHLSGVGPMAIIFQDADGNLAAWYMDGLNATSTLRLNPPSSGDGQWRVVGTFDLNRDGKTDLLFQHSGDGTVAVWYMDGINLTEGRLLNPSKPGGTWKVVAPK